VVQSAVHASLIYTYDFPGASGLAANQTNGQPSNATFGDFTRTNLNGSGGPPVFASTGWNQNNSIDPTQFEGFSITATGGFHLNLSSLTFDAGLGSPTGPQNMEVALFLNGSATAYATFDFAPTSTLSSYVFNFTALTDADNVTLATINFYGWNAAGPAGEIDLDNVATYGDISSVPEPSALIPILLFTACVFGWRRKIMKPACKLIVVGFFALLIGRSTTQASLIYLYDFPGGSGLAANQTNPQPTDATFGDFTRNNLSSVGSGPPDTFGSDHWSLNPALDPTIFEGFSITANTGFHLNLSALTFSAFRSATGPQNMEVGLFLNGSATAYATFDFSPTTSAALYSFNFTALTDSDNVTTATFKFYGWNAGGTGGQVYLDDVGTYGAISNLPETSAIGPVLLVLGSIFTARLSRSRSA
jgi:hypothetical protein